jgi:integrase
MTTRPEPVRVSPPKRRPRGTGGLNYRPSDGMWIGRVDFGWTPQGTRDRRTVSSKKKTEAQRKLRDLIRQRDAGETAASGTSRATVKAWAETWLPMHADKVRPTTYTTDAGAVHKWIVPTIGHRRLADLTPADLRALRQAIIGAGRSTTTALHAHKLLVKMLKDAIVEGLTVPPRVLLAPPPAKAANDRTSIPVEQALAILRVALARPDAPRWVAAILQGMRQGETLGLTWACVDLEAATVDVSWQLQRLTKGHATPDGWEARNLTGNLWLTRPKTSAGQRIIPLVPWMHAALTTARETWQPNPFDLVWVTETGLPIRAEADRETWKAIQAEAGTHHPSGRPWHLHECRHTTATMLLQLGVDRAVIEAILGQAVLVESYLHVGQAEARKALEAVADRLALGT